MFEKAKILHRDISINNIMISQNPADGEPRGFLIDLDTAIKVDTYRPSGAPHRTGTMGVYRGSSAKWIRSAFMAPLSRGVNGNNNLGGTVGTMTDS